MKRFKQITLMALAALACIITFSSCSSDEDPVAKSSGIVGEWIQAFRTDQGYGEYAQTVISYYIAKFNANNTGTQVVYYVYLCHNSFLLASCRSYRLVIARYVFANSFTSRSKQILF